MVIYKTKKFLKKRLPKGESVSSYPAMFPPEIPRCFIKTITKNNELIADPFFGRGTTLLEAAKLNRDFVGCDLNEYAFVLSKFKSENTNFKWFEKKFKDFWNKFDKNKIYNIKNKTFFYTYFNKRTFNEILFIKNNINKHLNKKFQIALKSIVLSILHGPEKKDKTSSYLSISMSNSYFMTPKYVKRYKKEKKLINKYRNTYLLVLQAAKKIYSSKFNIKTNIKIKKEDALKISFKKVKLLITSPPYTNIIKYKKFNLLKNWFLGESIKEIKQDKTLNDYLNWEEYLIFLNKFLINAEKSIVKNGYIVLIIGKINTSKTIKSVFDNIDILLKNTKLKQTHLFIDDIDENQKTSRSLGKRIGKKTNSEEFIVLTNKENDIVYESLDFKDIIDYQIKI